MKICKKCLIEKDESEFYIAKNCKSGLRGECKDCSLENQKKWRIENPDKVKGRKRNWEIENPDKVKESKRNWRIEHPEYNVKRYAENPEKFKEYQAKYFAENPEKVYKRNKKWRIEHPEYNSEYKKERKEIDPLYKLSCSIRSLIGKSFLRNGFKKSSKTANILGCTFEEFYAHIENQFTEGMSWDNRSLWHLDHIYPVSLAESEEHLLQLNHYTNFQPLWAEDNIRKGNKIIQ